MSYILNIDTTTEVCSVCISKDDALVSIRESEENFEHATLITKYIQEVLDLAGINAKELDAIAVSNGPGSYTGLRIGASTAKGLCYGLNIPLIAVDTMESLALGIKNSIRAEKNYLIVPMIDARRMEVYSGVYDPELDCVQNVAPVIVDEESFLSYLNKHEVYFGGNGSFKCKETIDHPNARFINVNNSSKYMIYSSFQNLNNKKFENVIYYEPFYLKGVYINKSDKNYF